MGPCMLVGSGFGEITCLMDMLKKHRLVVDQLRDSYSKQLCQSHVCFLPSFFVSINVSVCLNYIGRCGGRDLGVVGRSASVHASR